MTTPDTDPSADKAAARAAARARRRHGGPADPGRLADQVMTLLGTLPGPARVTCYASYGTEPDTGAMRSSLAAAGFEVLLPRVRGDALEWVPDGHEATVSTMGIAEPDGPAVELLPLRAMLVPALAVTPQGARLGKGGGYYDRVLSGLGDDRPLVAAIVDDDDVIDVIPTQPHDRRVDAVITPSRIIHCVPR